MSNDVDVKVLAQHGHVSIRTPTGGSPDEAAFLFVNSTGGVYLDRTAAVKVIDALTTLVENADAKEAAEAAKKAAEAKKLKAGDVVYVTYAPHARRTVISDEDADGFVDVVVLSGAARPGEIRRHMGVWQYARADKAPEPSRVTVTSSSVW